MPTFRRREFNDELPNQGIYLSQILKAEDRLSRERNRTIKLSLRSIPDGFWFNYYLTFSEKAEGLVTAFCHRVIPELLLPDDFEAEFILTADDCLHRLLYVDIVHGEWNGEPRAEVKAILKQAQALAKAPHLEKIQHPANLPTVKVLPIKPTVGATPRTRENDSAILLGNGRDPDLDAEPDDIPF